MFLLRFDGQIYFSFVKIGGRGEKTSFKRMGDLQTIFFKKNGNLAFPKDRLRYFSPDFT